VIAILLPANAPVLGALTKGIFVYQEGLVHGAVQSMRIVSMFALGLLFAWTTDPRDALYGLIGLGVPYGMAFMVITALRFLPVLLAEVAVVVSAQRLRGLDARSLLPTAALRTALLVLKPTLSNSLRRAGTLTLSVQSRAFDPGADRTYTRGFAWSPGTVLLVGVIVTLTLAIVTTKIIYLLYYNDVLYRSEWRTLYGWARIYL
jgi:energy-coupling factor transport system permease protein